jgi:hypothetical protein
MYSKIHPLAKERIHHVFPILKIFMGYDEDDSDDDEGSCDHCHVAESSRGRNQSSMQEQPSHSQSIYTARNRGDEGAALILEPLPLFKRVLKRVRSYFKELLGYKQSHDLFAILGPGIGSYHMI